MPFFGDNSSPDASLMSLSSLSILNCDVRKFGLLPAFRPATFWFGNLFAKGCGSVDEGKKDEFVGEPNKFESEDREGCWRYGEVS